MSDSKSLAVAQYILDRCKESTDPSVTPMQLLKLVYIAHGYMLGRYGRPLLDEPVQAWRYGPVVPSVYDAVKQYRSSPVISVPGWREVSFTPEEQEVMRDVARVYGGSNGIVLSTATHQPGTPWSIAWESAGYNTEMSNDIIENFYKRLLSQPVHHAL